jgi:hypothetical protein
MTAEIKLLIHRYGAFTVIVLVLFFLLAIVTLLSRDTWKEKLQASVSDVLSAKYGTTYVVGDYVDIQTPAVVSAAVYKITDTERNTEGRAVLLRLTGISGPAAAVYTYFDGEEKGTFAGYAANSHYLSGDDELDYNASKTQINYCARQIPVIVSKEVEKK